MDKNDEIYVARKQRLGGDPGVSRRDAMARVTQSRSDLLLTSHHKQNAWDGRSINGDALAEYLRKGPRSSFLA